jgi:phage gp16-like protein
VSLSKQRKAVIHVAKAQLHMADEDYRAMLARVAGVRSSNELDDAGFERVMSELERLGFRTVKRPSQAERPEGMATAQQIGRIRGLWKAYSTADDDLALGRWLEKHFHTSNVRFLESWRAGKAISVLEKMAVWARNKRAEQKGDAA